MLKITDEQIAQVEFDFDALTAQEMSDLNTAERLGNIADAAPLLAKAITTCPWGDPHDPQTYLQASARVYFSLSRRFGAAFASEVLGEKK